MRRDNSFLKKLTNAVVKFRLGLFGQAGLRIEGKLELIEERREFS